MVPPFPLHQMCKTEFPPLGTSELAQNASIKKNNEEKNKINTKKVKLNYSPSNFVFENISKRSKLKQKKIFHFIPISMLIMLFLYVCYRNLDLGEVLDYLS